VELLGSTVLVLGVGVEDDVDSADDVVSDMEVLLDIVVEEVVDKGLELLLVELIVDDVVELPLVVELLVVSVSDVDDVIEVDVNEDEGEEVVSLLLMGRAALPASVSPSVLDVAVDVLSVDDVLIIDEVVSALTPARMTARATSAVVKRAMAAS